MDYDRKYSQVEILTEYVYHMTKVAVNIITSTHHLERIVQNDNIGNHRADKCNT